MKLVGFVVGAAVGAGIAVLLAPKTGKEVRNQLFTGTDWNEQRERLTEAVNAGREQAMGRSDDLKHKIEETRARLRKQMEDEPQPS